MIVAITASAFCTQQPQKYYTGVGKYVRNVIREKINFIIYVAHEKLIQMC